MVLTEHVTSDVRNIVLIAEDEAVQRQAALPTARHLLLGLLRGGAGVPSAVMRNHGVSYQNLDRLLATVGEGSSSQNESKLAILQNAAEEATSLKHMYISETALFFALLRSEAIQFLLTQLKLDHRMLRQEVLDGIGKECG